MARGVDALAGDVTIPEAVAVLQAGRHRVYTVVDQLGRPIGLVSRGDALLWRVEGGHEAERLADRVSDASLPVIHPDEVVARVVDVMLATDQGRLPVVDPKTGALVGLLTRKDLLQVQASAARLEGDRCAYFTGSRRPRPA